MIPNDIQEELRQRYNPDGSTLRKAQMRMLDMLIYIDETCKELNITYQLNSGNVLGALRHGGFIPWDDDVDIIMKREDYNIFCKHITDHPHQQFKLQSHKTDPHYYRFWNTLRDTKSRYINNNIVDKEFIYHGLVIDIFPFEPGRIDLLRRIAAKIAQLNVRYFIGKHRFMAELTYQFQNRLINPIFNVISNLGGDQKKYGHTYGVGFARTIPKEILFPSKPITYEAHEFAGPADPKAYCETIYGNYMDLPKEEKRNIHQCTVEIW